jgi:xanthine dehydrogenase accessory factor
MSFIILLRGGGDLASGVAVRLHRAGFRVAISELENPLAVRRLVSFSEAVYAGEMTVEGVTARRVKDATDQLQVLRVFAQSQIPVLVDPKADAVKTLHPTVLVDARMTKIPPEIGIHSASMVIGLGPGFIAGENCHAAIETNRGHFMGRVIWQGAPQPDTGIPEQVVERGSERLLRAPASGILEARAEIADHIENGQVIAEVAGQPLIAPFKGVLRGLIHPGSTVTRDMKIGDLDPRDDPRLCTLVSDKSLAVAGGVLEAILSRRELRSRLWS